LINEEDLGQVGGEWGDEDLDLEGGKEEKYGINTLPPQSHDLNLTLTSLLSLSSFHSVLAAGDVGGDWELEDDDLKLDLEQANDIIGDEAAESYFVPPTQGTGPTELWQRNSRLPVDHVLAGAFDSAMRILNEELGVVNFAPLKPFFLDLVASSRTSLPCLPSVCFASPSRIFVCSFVCYCSYLWFFPRCLPC